MIDTIATQRKLRVKYLPRDSEIKIRGAAFIHSMGARFSITEIAGADEWAPMK